MRYPGGKGQSGVYQRIINLMPPHDLYIESHLGGGNILQRKKPAACSIAIDADPAVIEHWQKHPTPATTFICGDARSLLAGYVEPGRTLIYCDPPYVISARRSPARVYKYEYTDQEHRDLLAILLALPAWIILSGYRNAIYDDLLVTWHRQDFPVTLRYGIKAIESVWLNFIPGSHRHDYQYLGADFRERKRIKRRRARWRARLSSMPAMERAAMMEALQELMTTTEE